MRLQTKCGHSLDAAAEERLVEQESTIEICPHCLGTVTAFDALHLTGPSAGRPLRSVVPSSPWGQTYVQTNTLFVHGATRGGEGDSSYHFVSPTESYVFYNEYDMSTDSGRSVPRRKYFVDVVYNPRKRIFRGRIVWAPDTLGGESVWEYEIIFAADFDAIIGGQVTGFRGDDTADTTIFRAPRSHSHLQRDQSRAVPFSDTLTYFRVRPPPQTIFGQAFIQERYPGESSGPGVASYHFPRESAFMCTVPESRSLALPSASVLAALIKKIGDYETGLVAMIKQFIVVPMPYISYARALPSWRLSSGDPPPLQKPFTNCNWDRTTRTFRGDINWAPDSFGDVEFWRYKMVFSPDLSSICDGQNRTYKNAATAMELSKDDVGDYAAESRFSVQLHYYREGLAENSLPNLL